VNRIVADAGNRRRPQHLDAGVARLFNQFLVKRGTAETHSVAMRELGGNGVPLAQEPNPPEAEARLFRQPDTDSGGRGEGIGHQPFAASFIDRRVAAIGHYDA
jgi:hypothetical protein